MKHFLLIFLVAASLNLSASFPLFEELNYINHPVKTNNPKAQRYFNQGLIFIYGFNSQAAFYSFEEASKLDPNMAMAYWGMAYVLGPTFSTKVSTTKEYGAYDLIQIALKLSANGNEYEKSYIEALSKRYSHDKNPDFKQLSIDYKNTMKKVMEAYPDDLDAAALYAESSLDLSVDHLWKVNGKPDADDTEEIVAVLESVIKKDPNHIGANHFYIHTMEFSKHPEYALASANRFLDMSPLITHLVHVPSHIYLQVGFYQNSIRVNERAVKATYAYLKHLGGGDSTIGKLCHNLLYLTRSYTMSGFFEKAKDAANQLKRAVLMASHHQDAMMQLDYSTVLFVLIHFERWQEILAESPPPATMAFATKIWHLARAISFASLGKEDLAEKELAESKKINEKKKLHTAEVLEHFADARINQQKNQNSTAIDSFRKALAIQDSEPDFGLSFLVIMAEPLGNLLLKDKQFAEAEKVFRDDLNHHPLYKPSLNGLYKSLKAQSKDSDALWVKMALDG